MERKGYKWAQGKFGGRSICHYVDGGDAFKGVEICVNLSKCTTKNAVSYVAYSVIKL